MVAGVSRKLLTVGVVVFIEYYFCLQKFAHFMKDYKQSFSISIIIIFSYFQKQNNLLACQRFHSISKLMVFPFSTWVATLTGYTVNTLLLRPAHYYYFYFVMHFELPFDGWVKHYVNQHHYHWTSKASKNENDTFIISPSYLKQNNN